MTAPTSFCVTVEFWGGVKKMKNQFFKGQKTPNLEAVVKAEIFYFNEQGFADCVLLGDNGFLYNYNNAQHHVKPFSQKVRTRLPEDKAIDVFYLVDKNSRTVYRDGTVECCGRYQK